MERAEGSLANYIEHKGGQIPEEECKVIMLQILDGLHYLHMSSIVHRDLKPGNILMMSFKDLKNSVKICDFSISAKLNDAYTYELTDTIGTTLYKAPEQFTAKICKTV